MSGSMSDRDLRWESFTARDLTPWEANNARRTAPLVAARAGLISATADAELNRVRAGMLPYETGANIALSRAQAAAIPDRTLAELLRARSGATLDNERSQVLRDGRRDANALFPDQAAAARAGIRLQDAQAGAQDAAAAGARVDMRPASPSVLGWLRGALPGFQPPPRGYARGTEFVPDDDMGTTDAMIAPGEAVMTPGAVRGLGMLAAVTPSAPSPPAGMPIGTQPRQMPDGSYSFGGPRTEGGGGMPIRRYAKGTARVPGKGDGTQDTVRAKLPVAGAVVNKAAADSLGRGLIAALNKAGAGAMGMV